MSFSLFGKIEGDLDTSHWCRNWLFFIFVIMLCDKRYIDFKHFCHTKLGFLDFRFSENQFLFEFHFRFHLFFLIVGSLDFPNGYYQKVLCWKVLKWILAILSGFDGFVKHHVFMVHPIALEIQVIKCLWASRWSKCWWSWPCFSEWGVELMICDLFLETRFNENAVSLSEWIGSLYTLICEQ